MNNKKTLVWKYFKCKTTGKKMLGECIFCGKQFVNNETCMKRHLVKNCKNISNEEKQKFSINGSLFITKLSTEIAVSSSEDKDDKNLDNEIIISNNVLQISS